MAQTGTEFFIVTGGTKIQFEICKERELKRISEELTAQGKEIVNILEGEIKRPLTGWWQENRVIWRTVDVKPTYTITAPPPQPQSQPKPQPIIEKVTVTSDNFNSILDRIDLFLEDKEWDKAIAYCESALDFDPKNANIYLKYLLADYKCPTFKALLNSNKQFEKNQYYQKALRFGDEEFTSSLKETILRDKEQKEINRCDKIYNQAKSYMENQSEESYDSICSLLKSIPGYKDADELLEIYMVKKETHRCNKIYNQAKSYMESQLEESYDSICSLLKSIPGYKDADELLEIYTIKAEEYKRKNIYNKAVKALKSDRIDEIKIAIALFNNIKDFKDSNEQIRFCHSRISELETIAEKERQEREEKERLAREQEEQEQANKKKKRKIIAISIPSVIALVTVTVLLLVTVIIPNNKYNKALELKAQGKYNEAIIAFTEILNKKDSTTQIQECYYLMGKRELENKNYAAAITYYTNAGSHKDSVTQVQECYYLLAENFILENNLGAAAINFAKSGDYKNAAIRSKELWDKVAVRETISAGLFHTLALKNNNTVLMAGGSSDSGYDKIDWTDIVAVAASDGYQDLSIGLKTDGHVVALGSNIDGACNVDNWSNIVAISVGWSHTVGLKSDGTVVAVGDNDDGQCNVSGWTDIVAISAGLSHTVGLKSDGTVVAVGDNDNGVCNVSDWTNIVAISAGSYATYGLRSDGTVVTTDKGDDVSKWTDIVAISAGTYNTVGLKSNGTVVAVGDNDNGECNVDGWTDIVAISAGCLHTTGLKSDGTVIAVGHNGLGRCDVKSLKNIKVPSK